MIHIIFKKYSFCALIILSLLILACEEGGDIGPGDGGSGQAGSLASFAIANNHLYVISGEKINYYSIEDPSNPEIAGSEQVGPGLETLFAANNNLFIGSQTGMHIYDIINPTFPEWLSTYNHVTACDPVVVSGQYAYVTIRDGVDCRFGDNLLDVVDISDLRSPRVVATVPMSNPHGLGVDGNSLFVCEGEFGLKTFDITEPRLPVLTQHFTDFGSFDVIPNSGNLIVIGQDGLYQYDYQDASSLTLLSKILTQ